MRRPDKFIAQHVSYLEGRMKIAFANLDFPDEEHEFEEQFSTKTTTANVRKIITRSTKQKNDTDFDIAEQEMEELDEIEDPEENWKNKNKYAASQAILTLEKSKPATRRSKNSILNAQNIDICERIPFLTNGYIGAGVIVGNTCAFDSIFSTYACLYRDHSKFRVEMDSRQSSSLFCKFIATTLRKQKVTKQVYAERNKLLFSLAGQSGRAKKFTSLNCETGFGGVFSQICKMNDFIASIITKRTCDACESTSRLIRPLLPIEIYDLDITNIQYNIIDPTKRTEYCPECKEICVTEHQLNPVLALEVEPISSEAAQTVKIADISPQIMVNQKNFNLCGVIEAEDHPSHFICHIRRKNTVWQKYDDTARNVSTSDLAKGIKAFMLFYISSGEFLADFMWNFPLTFLLQFRFCN